VVTPQPASPRQQIFVAFLLYFGVAAPRDAVAQAMREVTELPSDCRSVIAPQIRGTVQPWQAYVQLEHCDRMKRLRRLSVLLPPDQRPRFYEGLVPASRLPAGFGIDIPVLRVVFPERTFFDTADATLRGEARQVVAIVAESLRNEPPDVSLFVAGHADARGDRSYNERLSIDRADSLARSIYADGVAFSSIWRIGFGEDMPLVAGMTPFAWDRNRRVEFLFAARPEATAVWLADQQIDGLCEARSSAEVAGCKERLSFRQGYDAIEVGKPPRVALAPTPNRQRRIDPGGSSSLRRIDLGEPRSAVGITPTTSLTGVAPAGTRKFRIDPINKRAPLTQLDL
jgi:outer membrane protein OmpA-like peptidoglycan-associated protein